MKITIIGSGDIGGTLGTHWAKQGHQVTFGSRDPQSEKVKKLLQHAGESASANTVQEAIQFGDVIILAIPFAEVENVLSKAGDLQQKILINCTVRFDGQSADEGVRRLAKNARVVRAFHSLTWEVLEKPQFNEANASLFISGEDEEAKQVVVHLATEIGLDPIDVGSATNMEQVESALFSFWSVLVPKYGREYAVRILRRNEI